MVQTPRELKRCGVWCVCARVIKVRQTIYFAMGAMGRMGETVRIALAVAIYKEVIFP